MQQVTNYQLEELKRKPLPQWSLYDVMWIVNFATTQTEKLYLVGNSLHSKDDRIRALEAELHVLGGRP